MNEREFFDNLFYNLKGIKKAYNPSYNDLADYNTNAQSYYDYLAKFNKLLATMIQYINQLMQREIEVTNSSTIDLTLLKTWINCYPNCSNSDNNYITEIKGDVIISTESENINTLRHNNIVVNNSTRDFNGIYTPNYINFLNLLDNDISENLKKILKNIKDIEKHYQEFLSHKSKTDLEFQKIKIEIENTKENIQEIKNTITLKHNELLKTINNQKNELIDIINREKYDLQQQINQLTQTITNVDNIARRNNAALQSIVANLYKSGAISSTNFTSLNFGDNNIAYGNINLFTQNFDGVNYIKTSKTKNDYDLALGVDV